MKKGKFDGGGGEKIRKHVRLERAQKKIRWVRKDSDANLCVLLVKVGSVGL
jgi:hypothetical protein